MRLGHKEQSLPSQDSSCSGQFLGEGGIWELLAAAGDGCVTPGKGVWMGQQQHPLWWSQYLPSRYLQFLLGWCKFKVSTSVIDSYWSTSERKWNILKSWFAWKVSIPTPCQFPHDHLIILSWSRPMFISARADGGCPQGIPGIWGSETPPQLPAIRRVPVYWASLITALRWYSH